MQPSKVLIVDDDHELVLVMHTRLSRAGYETDFAFDGRHALECVHRRRPDVIVLDVRMSGLDGLQTLERLRQNSDTRNIPVIMLSASHPDRRRALDAGAAFFLSKPYDGKEVVAAIKTVLDEQPKAANAGQLNA